MSTMHTLPKLLVLYLRFIWLPNFHLIYRTKFVITDEWSVGIIKVDKAEIRYKRVRYSELLLYIHLHNYGSNIKFPLKFYDTS